MGAADTSVSLYYHDLDKVVLIALRVFLMLQRTLCKDSTAKHRIVFLTLTKLFGLA